MVTDLKEIVKKAKGTEVELPGFDGNENITVLLRRPSLMQLASAGEIPNPLLATAASMFQQGIAKAPSDGTKFADMSRVMVIVARAALISPTMDELEENGIGLTDSQLVYIYNYVQSGVDVLRRFREATGVRTDS